METFIYGTKVTVIIDQIKALVELKNEGKIRYLSVSEVSAETIRRFDTLLTVPCSSLIIPFRAYAVHPITMIESEFSIWSTHLRKNVIPTIRELGIALLAYAPLGRGFLTGTLKKFEDIPESMLLVSGVIDTNAVMSNAYPFSSEDVRRTNLPRFSKENFDKNIKIVEAIEKLAKAKGITPAQFALAWVLHQGDGI